MAQHLLLNDIRTTAAKFNTGDILDDAQIDLTELTISGAVTTPYLLAYEELRLRFNALRKVETRTPAVVLFQSLSIAGLLP